MKSVAVIIKIKEHILEDSHFKDEILQKHDCMINHAGDLVFSGNNLGKFITFACSMSFLIAISTLFKPPGFILFVLLAASWITVFFQANRIEKNIYERNLLTHEDYEHLSNVISKEELQLLVSFYETEFYEDPRNKNSFYKLNLRDLLEPVDLKKYPDATKTAHQKKLNDYLNSVYKE